MVISDRHRSLAGFTAGALVGMLGGLIGLGGAEFRLPLLLGVFAFAPLEAVILNKAMSLLVVAVSLPFRTAAIPFSSVMTQWPVILNLLAGTLIGAWLGASWATRLRAETLRRTIAVMLGVIAVILVTAHGQHSSVTGVGLGPARIVVGVLVGVLIGGVAAFLGVAGGELLIPTLILLYSVDIKLAGSLSLAVSLPTMLVSFARYSRDRSFVVLKANVRFGLWMALGSLLGAFLGSRLLLFVPSQFIVPGLALILMLSAIKVWRHRT